MDLRNCLRCGRVFQYMGHNHCKECIKHEETEFRVVKEFLEENPSSTIDEVHESTEVSIPKILKFLREGRLMATDGLADVLQCERCGTSIRSGHYCKPCREKLERGIRELLPTEEDEDTGEGKMHISTYIRDRYSG